MPVEAAGQIPAKPWFSWRERLYFGDGCDRFDITRRGRQFRLL